MGCLQSICFEYLLFLIRMYDWLPSHSILFQLSDWITEPFRTIKWGKANDTKWISSPTRECKGNAEKNSHFPYIRADIDELAMDTVELDMRNLGICECLSVKYLPSSKQALNNKQSHIASIVNIFFKYVCFLLSCRTCCRNGGKIIDLSRAKLACL